MDERIKRIHEDVTELDQHVIRNKKNIKKLKKKYERAVNINERLIDRIKAKKREIFDLERGQYDICEVNEEPHAEPGDEEDVIKREICIVIEMKINLASCFKIFFPSF